MAFYMVEQTIGGMTVKFHRVVSTSVDMSTGAAEATLQSWSSQASAERNERPLMTRKFPFTPSGGMLHQTAQAQILSDPYWSSAEVL